MYVGTVCKYKVVAIDQRISLREAALHMRHAQVGALMVTDTDLLGTAVVGVLSDRDLALEVMSHGRDVLDSSVGSVLRGELVAAPYNSLLAKAIATMERKGVNSLIVTGVQMEPIGIVSLNDLIDAWAQYTARQAQLATIPVVHQVEPLAY